MSHGAFHNNAKHAINIDEVGTKYPLVKKAAIRWLATLDDFDLLGDGHSNAVIDASDVNEYLDDICDNYGVFNILDDENAEAARDRIEGTFKILANAFKKETGLDLATQYIGEAEDSYADVGDEWIFFVTNAEKTELTAPAKRFLKAGLRFSDIRWTTYG
jgi:hypothetical protein